MAIAERQTAEINEPNITKFQRINANHRMCVYVQFFSFFFSLRKKKLTIAAQMSSKK
jgi:hypothetical protein